MTRHVLTTCLDYKMARNVLPGLLLEHALHVREKAKNQLHDYQIVIVAKIFLVYFYTCNLLINCYLPFCLSTPSGGGREFGSIWRVS